MENHQRLLEQLMTTHGGPGFEGAVRDVVVPQLHSYAHKVEVDVMGNVVACIEGRGEGRRPRVLLAAHMDEIALVVARIEEGGFLRVAQTGGFDPRTLVGQEVVVHTRSDDLLAVVGSKPPHLTAPEERGKAAPLSDLYLDLAMPESAVRERVRIGDRVTLSREVYLLRNRRLAGKSLDNRASLAILLETLHRLRQFVHQADVYAVATVQEEVGLRGAQTVGFAVQPDVAIAIDVTFGAFPGQAADESFALDAGPAISFGPNLHRKVFQRLVDVAERHRIPYQIELSQTPVGADANAFQVAGPGLAAALVGIPIRYMHTSVETGSYADIEQCARLLAHYIAELDMAQVEDLSCY
ncbi:peptidase M42 [Alicyclobacillus tengchongensis]|nr:peptidase M42 [Alicyclobacillus tengchongensis]